MNVLPIILSVLVTATNASTVGAMPARSKMDRKVVIAYVPDWIDYTNFIGTIDFAKVTHLNVAFANPTDDDGTLSVNAQDKLLVDAGHRHKVKVLISIGGGGASEGKASRERYFDLMSDSKRAGFVAKLTDYVVQHNYDGLDVDLEGDAIGKDYGAFIDDLDKSLHAKGKLLTSALSATNGGGNVPTDALNKFDYVNLMAYDATGPWNPQKAGQPSSMDFAKSSVNFFLERGLAKSKLVLGVPFYGYGFGQAFTSDGYTYAQIVAQYPGADQLDQVGKTIWYNGIPTIQAKAKYVKDEGLAGVMIWSLDQDAKGKSSLLTALDQVLSR